MESQYTPIILKGHNLKTYAKKKKSFISFTKTDGN